MELGVPYVRQPADSVWCGAACAAMVLRFYGVKISLARVVKEMRIKSSRGITVGQLGSYFLEHGMNVTVQAWPPGMAKEFRSKQLLQGEAALQTLRRGKDKALKNKARIFCKESSAFVKRGGCLIFHPHSLDDIRNRLEANIPIIRSIDAKCFLDIPRQTGHCIVEYGITDRDSQVSEPYVFAHDPLRGPGKFISVQRMLDACDSWFGSAIYVTPKMAR